MNAVSNVLGGFVLAVALNACAMSGTGTAAPAPTSTTLEVINEGSSNLNIFAVREGSRYRLGRVDASATRTFAIPGHLLTGSFHLMALSRGAGEGYQSQSLVLFPGRQAHWKLLASPGEAMPRMSFFTYSRGSQVNPPGWVR